MDNDVTFLVSSCDKYSDLWDPFFSNFFKYWPDCDFDVALISNHKDFPDERVSVITVGEDVSYADNLRTAISGISSKWILLWLDDVIFDSPVDHKKVKRVISEAEAIGAGFVKLSTDLPLVYDDKTDLLIAELPKGIKYRAAIGLCLVQRDVLLKMAQPGLSAWDMDKSNMSDTMDERFCAFTSLAAKHSPFSYIHAVIKGKWMYSAVPALKKQGFSGLLKSRARQPIFGYLYICAYQARLYVMKTFKRYWY